MQMPEIDLIWIDWVILGVILVSALISIKRGFVREVLSLLTWVMAVAIAYLFGDRLAVLLEEHIMTPSLRHTVAMALLFSATLIVGAMVNYLIAELVRMTGLSGTDRFFGMIFGAARGTLVVLVILIFMPSTFQQDSWWRQSTLIPHFLSMERWSYDAAHDIKSLAKQIATRFG
jgi:membrane protein required for colicin V production